MSRADQFAEGLHFFAVRAPGSDWGYRSHDDATPPPGWAADEGLEVHAVDRPAEPYELFDGTGWAWDLVALREARWDEAKQIREERADGGCMTPAGRVDTDPLSRSLINGAVTMAQLAVATGQVYSTSWRLEDNSFASLDGPGMVGMGVAVGRFVNACYAASFQLGADLDAAVAAGDGATLLGFDPAPYFPDPDEVIE